MEPRDLPSVTDVMAALNGAESPRDLVADVARRAIDEARDQILRGEEPDPIGMARTELARLGRRRPTAVINAAGVLLNTNLGRAPLHPDAASAAARALAEYGNVEFDLELGQRGSRGSYAHELVAGQTGAEAALVVNNNAGALFLTLAALGLDRQVVISRGELIEIGGSFRLPELMAAAGVWLVEVGTTNRTRTDDYEAAVRPETAMILKVHPSNYRTVGFTEEADYSDLATVAHHRHLPFVADVGSGLLDAAVPWWPGPSPAWVAGEPAVRQTLAAGADLVLFSGDKLLGGPQAGIIAGRADLIERLARHPIARGVRCDGSTLAALVATLELYADGRGGEIPFWAMAAIPTHELAARSAALVEAVEADGEVIDGESVVGAGSVPGQAIPGPIIRFPGRAGDAVWHGLLGGHPPVVTRRREGDLVVDLRTVPPEMDGVLAAALTTACRS